jgi:PUA domain protein
MRRREAKALVKEAAALIGVIPSSRVEQAELEEGILVYFIDGALLLARTEGILFPTLKFQFPDDLPTITVDMGAVPYICNGADVMAPGMVEVQGEFQKDSIVVVKDVRHGKALAIGVAQASAREMAEIKRGRVVKNIHHVGDRLWRAYS